MTDWSPFYVGDGEQRDMEIPDAPGWRAFPRQHAEKKFVPPDGFVQAVNAAVYLRRPLLVTGPPGSGKSTAIEAVAHELRFGRVLKWHVTSRSVLKDGLYNYDAIGRIHASQVNRNTEDDIASFLELGPLGTALLPSERPRALLIDEIDKSDLDLTSDLLDVLEGGGFEIPELARLQATEISIREWKSKSRAKLLGGRIQCTQFPFIIMTSNGERDFPAPFLRRCIRYDMPKPTFESLRLILDNHLRPGTTEKTATTALIREFLERIGKGQNLAVDQLLNAVYIITGHRLEDQQKSALKAVILKDLSGG